MRIGLTYNLKSDHVLRPGDPDDRYEELDSEETIAALEGVLRASGHEPVRLGWGPRLLDRLDGIDAVFNLAEGIGGRGRESQVPALLEMLGIPCTGSSPLSIGLTLDKALAKRLAQSAGIATAPFAVARSVSDLSNVRLRYPLFVKPAAEGSSMGIGSDSRCENAEQLHRAGRRMLDAYGPLLIEEFLDGDEFTVGMIDGEVIGVMQVVPHDTSGPFVYSVEVKRDYERQVTYVLRDDEGVERVARQVWQAFDLRDVARIDVRCGAAGQPNFIEVNPLPGVHPRHSDLVILARALGWTHADLIGRIVDAARRRWGR
jgi:D-alanine-D-alanine ligase